MEVSRVLVVDGDRTVRNALVTCLQFVGMDAHGAENAAAARFWLTNGVADVMVLSDELPDGAPDELVRHVNRADAQSAAIIVLTRRPEASPNYRADDTLRRPVPVSRIVERVEALLHARRVRRDTRVHFRELSLDVATGRACWRGREVQVGNIETRLLAFFMLAPDKVFSRIQLLQRLWPVGVRVEERTVDAHIRRLRQALSQLGCEGYIQTVRGSGYRFSAFA